MVLSSEGDYTCFFLFDVTDIIFTIMPITITGNIRFITVEMSMPVVGCAVVC